MISHRHAFGHFDGRRLRSAGRKKPMTVCIAASCNVGSGASAFLIGAADRMITVGDIEFEPDQTKVFPIASHTVVMIAGDMRLHAEVCPATYQSLQSNPPDGDGLMVKDIAERYAEQFAEYRRKIAERRYLMPLGIKSARDFLFRQRDMAEEEARTLREKLLDIGLTRQPLSQASIQRGRTFTRSKILGSRPATTQRGFAPLASAANTPSRSLCWRNIGTHGRSLMRSI